ncbi:MAG: hypothetical protein HOO95_01510 [Gallionella sp.]|nr:hypothetical protein [Gallionella sp.]
MASSSISEGATVATDTSLTLALSQGARGQGQNPSNVPFPSLPLGGMSLALEEQLAIRLGEQTTPAKSLVIAGLLQRNRYGGLNAVLNNSTMTQYDVAANSTLVNGSLSNAPSTGSGQAGWATQGSVTFTPSAFVTDPSTGSGRTVASFATLNEISTTQTRLSQVFMVNANDRYLSFTLSGTALDGTLPLPNPLPQAGEGVNGTASGSGLSPSDAFEVALLNANTGASLLGSNGPSTELRTGLTHSDAFLNLKGDCTEHLAQGVTRTLNADGSSTYRVDLSGMNL